MEAAKRAIAFDLRKARGIAEIDAITDRAANLGICRQRWEVDARFSPEHGRVKLDSLRTAKPSIPGIADIGRI